MARPRKGTRLTGPKMHHGKWRYFVHPGDGSKAPSKSFASKEAALKAMAAAQEEMDGVSLVTIAEAIAQYELYLRNDKGNQPGTIEDTVYRLRALFTNPEVMVRELDEVACKALYLDLRTRPSRTGRPMAAASHRNILAECKTFMRWCIAQRFIKESALEGVKGVGKRNKGKAQLRIDELRKWLAQAHALAGKGDEGAIAAMMTVLMGLRASEVVYRVVRDLDDNGTLLHVGTKTAASVRAVEVPEELREYLAGLVYGKGPEDRLWSEPHWRDWPREQVQEICRRACVPEVTAHGMRGLFTKLGSIGGADAAFAALAKRMGHTSPEITKRVYMTPGEADNQVQAAALAVIHQAPKAGEEN